MKHILISVLALALVAGVSAAQTGPLWGDDFENSGTVGSAAGPYNTTGLPMSFPDVPAGPGGNGGWNTWYGGASAPEGSIQSGLGTGNYLDCSGPGVGGSGCDMIMEFPSGSALPGNPAFFDQATFGIGSYPSTVAPGIGGVWVLSADLYVPSSFPTGMDSCYFIVNDLMNNLTSGPTQWIGQLQFNHASGIVLDDQRSTFTPSGGACIQYDTWVNCTFTVDLDNDEASYNYGGQDVGTGPLFVTAPAWNNGLGTPQIDALDVFTVGSAMYWDNIELARLASSQYETNNPDSAADAQGVFGNGVGSAESVGSGGQTISLNYISAIVVAGGLPFDAIIQAGGSSPALLATGGGQILNVDPLTPFWLSGVPFGFGLTHPGNGANFSLPVPLPGGGGACTAIGVGQAGLAAKIGTIQYGIFSPTHVDGIDLSQGVTLSRQ